MAKLRVKGLGDIVTVLNSVDETRWPEVREALAAGGSGHAFAPDLDFGNPPEIPEIAYDFFQEAIEQLEQDRAHQKIAADLHASIEAALTHIRRAKQDIQEMSNMGDIEFLEGDGEVGRFLEDATRMLKAAQAMKHTDETGEMK